MRSGVDFELLRDVCVVVRPIAVGEAFFFRSAFALFPLMTGFDRPWIRLFDLGDSPSRRFSFSMAADSQGPRGFVFFPAY